MAGGKNHQYFKKQGFFSTSIYVFLLFILLAKFSSCTLSNFYHFTSVSCSVHSVEEL